VALNPAVGLRDKKMAKFWGKFLAIVALALLSAVFSVEGADSYKALSVIPIARETAPDFSLKQVGGKSIRLSSYRGNLVLLGFFKTF